MKGAKVFKVLVSDAGASTRIVLATVLVCCLLYGGLIFALAQVLMPRKAEGSLVRDGGGLVVGSALIAQNFSRSEFFWPRPSAVGHDASAGGGSNLSPASPELRAKGIEAVKRYGATSENPLPADLATASGSGLDPHITLSAALCQADRVAAARGLPLAEVRGLVEKSAERTAGVLVPAPLVNVLALNMALERLGRGDGR